MTTIPLFDPLVRRTPPLTRVLCDPVTFFTVLGLGTLALRAAQSAAFLALAGWRKASRRVGPRAARTSRAHTKQGLQGQNGSEKSNRHEQRFGRGCGLCGRFGPGRVRSVLAKLAWSCVSGSAMSRQRRSSTRSTAPAFPSPLLLLWRALTQRAHSGAVFRHVLCT